MANLAALRKMGEKVNGQIFHKTILNTPLHLRGYAAARAGHHINEVNDSST